MFIGQIGFDDIARFRNDIGEFGNSLIEEEERVLFGEAGVFAWWARANRNDWVGENRLIGLSEWPL